MAAPNCAQQLHLPVVVVVVDVLSSSLSQHHSYRTFLGLTCLMQISTREQDYIIDTLELRGELYLLNEVFTDPAIVKVTNPSAITVHVPTSARSRILDGVPVNTTHAGVPTEPSVQLLHLFTVEKRQQ